MKVQRMYEAKMVLVEYVSSSSSWIFRGQKNTHFATVDKNLATFWLITSNVAFGCCCMLLLLLKYWHEWKRLTGLYSLKLRDLCWMHSNDSHQCPILAADLFWDKKWIHPLWNITQHTSAVKTISGDISSQCFKKVHYLVKE